MPFIRIFPFMDVSFLDRYSLYNWSEDIVLHEMSHIYQFSQNSQLDRIFWPLFNILTYRNQFLPLWFLEGHSVLIESLYGSGGRLYSGFVRALVFAQIKENNFFLKSLFRNKNDPFYFDKIYFHGGYFWAYLDSLYGSQAYNLFYNSNTKWPFFPVDYIGLNASFKKTFRKGLRELFEGYKEHYFAKAQNQKFLPQEALLKSKAFVPINSDKQSLYFLISDLKSPSWLVIFDKKSKQFKKEKTYLPLGKLFKKEGEFVSSTKLHTDTVSVEYSLSDKNYKALSPYNSQQVLELKEDHSLSLNTQNSHKGNALLLNREFYDWTHSSAVMDFQGSVYYFKQNQNLRTLYKDKKAMISFKAYFSYPVEADSQGLYFIAATAYGSSLFVYDNRDSKIYRLSDSDRIVFARKINSEEFLVSEIGAQYYEYKILKTIKSWDQPFLYQYSFKKESVFEDVSFLEDIEIPTSIKKYHSLKDLRLLNFNLMPMGNDKNWLMAGSFNFADPLSYNTLAWTGELQRIKMPKALSTVPKLFYETTFSYSYNKYRPVFKLSFSSNKNFLNLIPDKKLYLEQEENRYKEDSLKPTKQELEESYNKKYGLHTADQKLIETLVDLDFLDKKELDLARQNKETYIEAQDRSLNLSVAYPLFRNTLSVLTSELSMDLGQRRFFDQALWKNYTRFGLGLKYLFERRYPFAYSYHKKSFLNVNYKLLTRGAGSYYHTLDTRGEWFKELIPELFFSLRGRVLLGYIDRLNLFPTVPLSSINWSTLEITPENLYQADINLLKVFNHSAYFLSQPLYLKRWAGLTGLSVVFFKKHGLGFIEDGILLPFIGWEGEFGLFDKTTFFAGFKGGVEIKLPSPLKSVSFGPHWSFWIGSGLF